VVGVQALQGPNSLYCERTTKLPQGLASKEVPTQVPPAELLIHVLLLVCEPKPHDTEQGPHSPYMLHLATPTTPTTGATGALTTGTLATGALTTGTLATGAVTTGALTTGALTIGAVATGALTTGVLTTGALTTGVLTTGALTTGTAQVRVSTAGPTHDPPQPLRTHVLLLVCLPAAQALHAP